MLPQAAKLPGTSGLLKKMSFLEKQFCPRQRSCLGHVACSKKSHGLRKSSAPGSEAAREKWFVQKNDILRKSSAPGSEAARDKWLVEKTTHFLRTKSAPGSEAAQDKWLVQKNARFLRKKVLPQARPSAHAILAWVSKSSVGLQVWRGSPSLAWVSKSSLGL